jgi:hypothetical protein
MGEAGDETLRAKYLDWCSARLAERFLDLSPEEIYELARPEGGAEPDDVPSSTQPLPHPTHPRYRVLVQRVTEVLLERTPLPTFEQWSEAYGEQPERFDAEMLGFWKDGSSS